MKNTKSSHCWHVMGILHRQNRSNEDASKNLKMASRLDPNNATIVRELAALQAQNKDWLEHLDTRQKLLENKNIVLMNWSGLAMANYFVEDHSTAMQIVDSLIKITDKSKDTELKPSERHDLLIFKALCIEKEGKPEELLKFLRENQT